MKNSTFFYKWILPIAIFVFSYLSIGSSVDASFNKNDLTEVTGYVSKFEYYRTSSRGSSHNNMKIHLSNGDSFKITHECEDRFSGIENELKDSKQIHLFHRSVNQSWWRLGSANLVYHLEVGNSVIIDIAERQKKSQELAIFTAAIAWSCSFNSNVETCEDDLSLASVSFS